MIKLTHISDTHGYHNKLHLNGGDILIHSGDIVDYHRTISNEETIEWLSKTPYKYKILVLGNHDSNILNIELPENVFILNNQTIELLGINFYGVTSNLIETNSIHNFNQLPENKIKFLDVYPDILITHGPPKGIFDIKQGNSLGSTTLLDFVKTRKPKYHLFGHAHHWRGIHNDGDTIFCNSSITYNVRQKIVNGSPLDILY
jgi:Icc-related predicted phosphoesterase